VLGKEIPDQIYQHIGKFSADMIAESPARGTAFKDCVWALHPGGPMILQAITDCLGLTKQDVLPAWDVLRKYGNMSSCSLMFVFDEIRKKPRDHAWVPALAFGPGLNVEGAMLRACF